MLAARTQDGAIEDRSGRLILFGIVAVLVGGGLVLFSLLYVALPFILLKDVPVAWRSVLAGAVTYALLGGIFAWAGVGSIRKRRWARPVMLVLAWSWLLAGGMMLLFSAFLLDEMLVTASAGGPTLPPEAMALVKGVTMAVVGVGGVLLPALFVIVYRDRHLLLTCERAHPERGFTDDCPVAVLGLSLGLAAAALLALPLLFNPVVPLFGRIVVGWVGAALTLATALACAAVAYSTFKLETRGWWGATVLMVLIGASTTVTFAIADPDLLFEALAQSGGQEFGLSESGPVLFWASLIVTVLSVFYMIGIRGHFPFGRR